MIYSPENLKLMNGLNCLNKNCEQNYFAGGKHASFPFIRSFRQSNRNSNGSEKNMKNSEGKGGRVVILKFREHGEISILEFPRARGRGG